MQYSLLQLRNHFGLLATLCLLGACLSSEEPEGTDSDRRSFGGNAPPKISGSPQSAVKSGDMYSFRPNASDPDGDTLAFSISNKPIWADFNSQTGQLSGQPLLGNVGTYNNISISVTDGSYNTSLSPFAVTVTQVALASTTLSWTAPTENSDGSPLLDLAGYRIYYGQNSGQYSNTVDIDNAGMTTVVVENLVPGTYYFVATARNSLGIESGFSNEAVKAAN